MLNEGKVYWSGSCGVVRGWIGIRSDLCFERVMNGLEWICWLNGKCINLVEN